MIYSPCYHGKHNLNKYEEMRKSTEETIIESINKPGEILHIHLDFLFKTEIKHWFYHIFFYAVNKHEDESVYIYFFHKDKKMLRKARQLLRTIRLPYSDIHTKKWGNYIVMDLR